MNPIALRLSAISLELEGSGMPEIIEALQVAEREIIRLEEHRSVTDAMVDRFLSWPLPQSVCSDLCVTDPDYKFPRSGTCLLTATEAHTMLEHVLGVTSPQGCAQESKP